MLLERTQNIHGRQTADGSATLKVPSKLVFSDAVVHRLSLARKGAVDTMTEH